MKKVILKRNVFIQGEPYKVGDKVDLPDNEAKHLVNVGKAAWPPESAEAKASKETATSQDASNREKR